MTTTTTPQPKTSTPAEREPNQTPESEGSQTLAPEALGALLSLDQDTLERLERVRGGVPTPEWIAQAVLQRLDLESPEALVDLDAPPVRPRIKAKGTLFELRRIDEFGPVDQHRLNRDGKEFAQLWESEHELTEDEGARLTFLADRMFDQVIDAPAAKRKQFTAAEKCRVVLAFFYGPARQLAQLIRQMQQTAAQPGSEPVTTS